MHTVVNSFSCLSFCFIDLQANLELAKLRSARDVRKSGDEAGEEGPTANSNEDNSDGDEESPAVYTYSSVPVSHGAPSSARAQLDVSPRVVSGSPGASPKRSARTWAEDDYELAGQGNNVKMALVESTIGESKHDEEVEYCVEEVDSDED